MKKVIVLSGLMMMSLLGMSQVSIGVKAGISNNKVSIDETIGGLIPEIKGMTGYTVGAFATIPISNNLSFRPEVNFSRRGFSMSEGTSFDVIGIDIPVGARVVTNLNYIETPLLMQYEIGNEKASIFGIAGLGLGYATSGYLQPKAQVFLEWNLPRINIDFNDEMYSRVNTSGIIGLGGSIQTQTGKIVGDVRYEHGFNDLVNLSVIDTGISNRSVSVSLGYAMTF